MWNAGYRALGGVLVASLLGVPSRSAGEDGALVATTRVQPSRYELKLPEKVGLLRAGEERSIAFEVPGRLAEIVEEGERVAKGAPVARLDDSVERAEVRAAEARLAEAERESRRLGRLQGSGAVSASARQAAETALSLRRAELEMARARLARRQQLAEFEGVVVDRRLEPGEIAVPGAEVARLMQLDHVRLEVGIPGYQLGGVARGARARVHVAAFPGETFEGVVTQVARAAREGSPLFRVTIEIANPDRRLRPGMSARATIVTRVLENVLVVPLQSLVERGGERWAFFVEQGRVRARAVPAQAVHADVALLPADRAWHLVVRGQELLEDGVPVTVNQSVLSEVEAP
ncbi:MAG: efflux RND transporter periplasmic adaptor subunit [Myxococcota bacterium]